MKVVLSGSGIQYPLHAGALWALVDEGYTIDKILGVSGGAIVGGAVASGYTPGKELNNLILDTLPGPNDLLDPHCIPFWRLGYYKGDRILEKFHENMVTSFEDTDIPLHVLTVNIDRKKLNSVFGPGYQTHTNLPRAVRASMTFPFVFEPVKIAGDRHIDGGVSSHFPIDFYDGDVVGFRVSAGPSKKSNPSGMLEYGQHLVSTMIRSSNREHIEDALHARVVELRSDTGVLDLQIDRSQASAMIHHAYQHTREKLP